MLAEHVELTEKLISRLQHHGISYVYILDGLTDDIVVPDLLSEETRRRATREIRNAFRKTMEEAGRKRPIHHQPSLGKTFREVLNIIVDDLTANKDAMIMLTNMSITDNYLYQHSLNVCIYSTMLGTAYGYTRDELTTLGLGALLHDIGKTHIPLEILAKPGRLTDEEMLVMRSHAEIGFRLLKDEPNIPLLSAHCALQHHERIDGSGYPRGIGGTEIHDYAKWIGLVDSYDAMTTARVYKSAMLPHQALDILYSGAGTMYDLDKLTLFRDKIAIYPLGLEVKLSTGERGVVVDVNSASPQRPILRMVTDEQGNEIKQVYEVDLSKRLDLSIVGI
ncbi:HD-GYP domain-containing protein [Paenibacillus turpanensis]|uniref:HD-GYP domain-containing protein n=1 Tax=Paenibacillus turpanensis TaxID=2689078 RepID=UPI003132B33A